jgi:NADH dehydrogenase
MHSSQSPGLATLIGGTGFIGTALAEALAGAGWRLNIVSRTPARVLRLAPLGDVGQIAGFRGDVRVPASLLPALEGATLAINLVGILDEKGGQRFAEVQARGAAAAAAAAARANVAHFIQVSAIGADPASPSAYGRTKGEGEAGVRAAFPAAVIVRPSLVFGAEDGFTNRFAKLIASAPAIPLVAAETRFQPVFVQDVAAALAALAGRLVAGEPVAPLYELGGPEILSMRRITALIATAIGADKPQIEVPDAGARLLASFGFLPGAPLTRDQYLMLQRDNVTTPGTPGLAELGIPATPLAAVAPDWLARYRAGGRFAATTP